MVTEPTPFGLHDLRLMARVLEDLKVPAGIIINRSQGPYQPLEAYCQESGIPVPMRIPYDRRIAELYARGDTLVEHIPGFKQKMMELFREVEG